MATQNIVANAQYHSQLLASIAELEYVPSALTQQESFIANLEAQRSQTEAAISKLAKATKKERKEHESLRDSTARRLAHKLTGRKEKFEAKASKEEREYVEALEREMRERDALAAVEQLIKEANDTKADLTAKSARHSSLKADLAALYSRIFDGPTQGGITNSPKTISWNIDLLTCKECTTRYKSRLTASRRLSIY